MDSLKSIVVVAILLGVLYGIYQVINDEDSPVSPPASELAVGNLLDGFDREGSDDRPEATFSKKEQKVDGGLDQRPPESGQPQAATATTPGGSAFNPLVSAPGTSAGAGQTTPQLQPPPTTPETATGRFVFPEKKGPPLSEDRGFAPGVPPSLPPGEADLATRGDNGVDNRGIYQPTPASPGELQNGLAPSGNVQINAEAGIRDPRNRFIRVKDSEFGKIVLEDMDRAEQMIKSGDFLGALKTISKYYDDPRLTREENQNLVSWLDPLAGKVIYSVEHHLQDKYYVRQNNSLKMLSVQYKVPAELILNINRQAIVDPKSLVPGTELKMVKGPFHAEVSLSKRRLTLFVQDLYAGSFSIRIGNEPLPKPGEYRVLSKSRVGQDYVDQNNQRIEALAPSNPYGKYHLDLGKGMSIHGASSVSDANDQRGCISLNAIDSEDVHNILTTESSVIIVE